MKRSLDRYAAKRSFTRTPEPAPSLATDRRGPLLFVVQRHAARHMHYDFRLELGGVLKSWAVPKGPTLQLGDKRLAVEVEDHPFDYASFEGVIPAKQYGAGSVIVWDCGSYSPDEGEEYSFDDRAKAERRVQKELADGKLSFFLRGEKLKGSFALVRTSTGKQWLLLKHKDRFAVGNDVLANNRSVLSGNTLDDLTATRELVRMDASRLAPAGPLEKTPQKLDPMLAEIGEGLRTNADWVYEPKLDGYRVIAIVKNGVVRLQSRRGIDLTAVFPEVVKDLAAQGVEAMILDGEIVVFDKDGHPSFNALQNRVGLKVSKDIEAAQREAPAALICFDLLHFAGINLRGSPYVDRRRYLSQSVLPSSHLQVVYVQGNAEELYAAALDNGFEGIVAKRKDSVYLPGRRSIAWLKFKSTSTAEFVIGGYTQGRGARDSLGALLLGYWKGQGLIYAGHVGSGLSDAIVKELGKRIAALTTKTSPFAVKPPLHRPTTWLRPELVAEVTFAGWTPDGLLRAPVFMRLREDIAARKVRMQKARARTPPSPSNEIDAILQQLDSPAKQIDLAVAGHKIRLTNLDREYWPATKQPRQPAITKRDHLRYLAGVSPYMLPHLQDRPLTMIRMPEGINGERFFQKHWQLARPDFVETVTVHSEHKQQKHEYILGNNLPTLLWLGQVGTLEFHVWHSRARVGKDTDGLGTDYSSSAAALESSVLNYPDYLVFDIDPYIYSGKESAGAEPEFNKKGFAMGRRVALWIHALLKQMSLEALVKTSGKTGLHVFVPIERSVTFDEAREICEVVGRHAMKDHPKDITMEWAVIKRTGKIFIDYNMNVRGKTLNVAYSPRGVTGAPVSMPLTWEELEAAEPGDFTMRNAVARLEKTGDRWHDALSAKQSLTRAFAG